MISARFIALVALCCSTNGLSASPRSDLSSTNQQTRDAAAKILRATYVPPPRTNWDSLIASLKLGSAKTNIISSLERVIVRPEGGGGSGTFEAHQFRLDDVWILECYFNSDVFSGSKLFSSVLDVWVDPPPNFTGLWTTYQVNGQKSYELYYKVGQRDGAVTSFYDDGSRAVLTHFVAGMQEGDETGYYPSGKVSYRGVYKTNAMVGTWTHYNEDGTVQSKEDRSKP
jgi:hypothetical protein